MSNLVDNIEIAVEGKITDFFNSLGMKKDKKAAKIAKSTPVSMMSPEDRVAAQGLVKEYFDKLRDHPMKRYVRISIVDRNPSQTIIDSPMVNKIGGKPAGCKNHRYTAEDEMEFVAQVNLKSLPVNQILPRTGILQFWNHTDDFCGNSAVRYIAEKDIVTSADHVATDNDGSILENSKSCRELKFTADTCLDASKKTDLFDATYGLTAWDIEDTAVAYVKATMPSLTESDITPLVDDIWNERMWDTYLCSDHNMFGLAQTTQSFELDSDDTLLLQLDSESPMHIGDCGIAHWTTDRKSLRNIKSGLVPDTSFEWDCC